MEKISACLVVYNEEKLIGRCLDSLRGVVDEIILVHDGECNDKTLEIAKNYGAKIFIRPHIGGSEWHRPFSLKQATNNWILIIDADEYLSPELKNKISSLILDKDISAYELLWPLWDGKKEINVLWPYKRVLFRREKTSFLGTVHFIGKVQGRIKKINLKLCHQPDYNNFSYESFKRKQLAWAYTQANNFLKDFSVIEKFNWSEQDWSRSIKYRRRFPLLLLPVEFIWTFFKKIFSGNYKMGLLGLRDAFMMASYRAAVNYHIYKLKHKK